MPPKRLMVLVLRGLCFVFVYLDDIPAASSSKRQHTSHLRQVFQRLAACGLIINPSKCQFGLPILDFLGHCISAESAVPLPKKFGLFKTFRFRHLLKHCRNFGGWEIFTTIFSTEWHTCCSPLYGALKSKKANVYKCKK